MTKPILKHSSILLLWSVVVVVVVVSLLVWVSQFHWLRKKEKNKKMKEGE